MSMNARLLHATTTTRTFSFHDDLQKLLRFGYRRLRGNVVSIYAFLSLHVSFLLSKVAVNRININPARRSRRRSLLVLSLRLGGIRSSLCGPAWNKCRAVIIEQSSGFREPLAGNSSSPTRAVTLATGHVLLFHQTQSKFREPAHSSTTSRQCSFSKDSSIAPNSSLSDASFLAYKSIL